MRVIFQIHKTLDHLIMDSLNGQHSQYSTQDTFIYKKIVQMKTSIYVIHLAYTKNICLKLKRKIHQVTLLAIEENRVNCGRITFFIL